VGYETGDWETGRPTGPGVVRGVRGRERAVWLFVPEVHGGGGDRNTGRVVVPVRLAEARVERTVEHYDVGGRADYGSPPTPCS